jgi:hypothetical protein
MTSSNTTPRGNKGISFSVQLSKILCILLYRRCVRHAVASWLRHYTTGRKVMGSILDVAIGFFNWHNPSSRTMALGSTRPLTEMSTMNLPGGKERPAHKADNLTVICEPIFWKILEPRRLTTLCASTVCYRDSFYISVRGDIKTHIHVKQQVTLCFVILDFNTCIFWMSIDDCVS